MSRFALAAFLLTTCATLRLTADEPLRIGTITVHTNEVFSKEEGGSGALYRMANKFHMETRPSLIRGFLLFKEGDVYEPARLRETERNLRALKFLRGTAVRAGTPHDGVVDVAVTTDDAWAIEPGTSGGRKGGASTFGFEIVDSNLAGSGRQLSLGFKHGTDRSRGAVEYFDPAFIRPYMTARLTYAQTSDGFDEAVSVRKPFYSFTSRSASEVSFEKWRRDDRLYRNGGLTGTLRDDHRQFTAAYGVATSLGERSATRWMFGFRGVDDYLSQGSGNLRSPVDERTFRYVFTRVNRVNDRFITWNFVDRDIRYQDINLGREYLLEAAFSPAALGARRMSEFVNVSTGGGATIGPRAFAIGRVAFQSRIENGLRNAVFSGDGRYVRRFQTALPQTFVAHAAFNRGWNLDPEVQFFADGGAGLRGYRLHAFQGHGNLVANFEQRISLGRELLHLVSPGIVGFFDAGIVNNGSHYSGLKTNLGVGFRIGLPRSSRNLLRLDIGYALQRDPLGRRGLLISFSSSQAF